MTDEFLGALRGKDASGSSVRIIFDADAANLAAGGGGRGGDLALLDDTGNPVIWLDAGGTEASVGGGPLHVDPDLLGESASVITVTADGTVRSGGHGRSGAIVLRNADGKTTAELRVKEGGDLFLNNGSGAMVIALRAVEDDHAGAWIGGQKQTGWVVVRNKAGHDVASVGGESGDLSLNNGAGAMVIKLRAVEDDHAGAWIGGQKQTGWVVVRNKAGNDVASMGGESGLLELRDESGKTIIQLKADTGAARFGGQGVNGDVLVFSSNAPNQNSDQAAVWIKGDSGDIVLRNADCAEEFEVAPDVDVQPGAVLAVGEQGKLRPSTHAYDRRVAGVASGGGENRPGIVLGHRSGDVHRTAIALAGRVDCYVDAGNSPIEVGDLLTTSETPGHAMKAVDSDRAFGAVLGKALQPVSSGKTMIPILVSLQ